MDRILLSEIYARTFGYISEDNSPEIAKKTLLRDIQLARNDIKILSCSRDSYLLEEKEFLDSLNTKLNQNPKINAEFILYEEVHNKSLEELAIDNKIKLLKIKKDPSLNLRVVDNYITYVSNSLSRALGSSYCWTFGNKKALKDRLDFYNTLKTANQLG